MIDAEVCFDGKDYEGALEYFQSGFKIIPEPQNKYEETTSVIGAIADCFYSLKDFEKAEQALRDVLLCPGGADNPFIRLRRGQVYHYLGNREQARTELTTAFLNGGLEIFEGEDEFKEIIADVIDSF
jgi:tetratricopeptide (TPR) repeat protein